MVSGATPDGALEYLGDDTSWSLEEVQQAFWAEYWAQRAACRFPDGRPNADLEEALYRRVAHNLAVRALPLGLQATLTDSAVATTRVGGLDAEVRRLEAPYRKRMVG